MISLAAYIPYIVSVIRQESKPKRVSWIIWALVDSIIALSYREAGANYAFLTPAGYALGSSAVVLLSVKYGIGGWSAFDRNCVLGAALGLLLWLLLDSPLSALMINVGINFLGALPTIRKNLRQPGTESKTAWSLMLLGAAINLFAVEEWNFSLAAYPVSMVLIVGGIVLSLFGSRLALGAKPGGISEP